MRGRTAPRAAIRAERHADADLAPPFADERREQAIEPQRGADGEGAERFDLEAPVGQRVVDGVAHRHHGRHRLPLVERSDDAADEIGEPIRIAVRAHGERQLELRRLRVRAIQVRPMIEGSPPKR
ncbi:MAG TPA: hypothetical protein VFO19_22865 [Vicinamibacterales bacterium]|nr:hypothetical protein [Vicinamibacterales bacterium]